MAIEELQFNDTGIKAEYLSDVAVILSKSDVSDLLNRIERLDPCKYNSAEMKWEIIRIIKEKINGSNAT